MKGKIVQWKDDKGFGFIVSDEGKEKIFFHISAVKTKGRRPRLNDVVLYETMHDSQGRLKAKAVVIEGVVSSPKTYSERRVHTEPPNKNALDYLSIVLLIGSLAGAAYGVLQTGSIKIIIPFGVLIIIAIVLLNRQKKPIEKKFSCARCKRISEHDKRTIKAWNNGFHKFYCSVCHQKWLAEHPRGSQQAFKSSVSRRGGGCLTVSILLVMVPIIAGKALYQWIA